MDRYSFETVWPDPSDAIRANVVAFWLQEGALSREQAVERAAELLVVCSGLDGSVVAVSTAVPSFVHSLGLWCYYFRAFVARAHRAQGLRGSTVIYQLIRKSYDELNSRFQQGIDRDIIGLYLEVENRSVQRHRNELIWTDLGANVVFIGTLTGGRHARVWYFDNATLPPNC